MDNPDKFELSRLRDIEALVREMFRQADEAGLLVGIGRTPGASEGPIVAKLRLLIDRR